MNNHNHLLGKVPDVDGLKTGFTNGAGFCLAAKAAGARHKSPPFDEADFLAAQDDSWKSLTRSRERDECRQKLQRLSILRGDSGEPITE